MVYLNANKTLKMPMNAQLSMIMSSAEGDEESEVLKALIGGVAPSVHHSINQTEHSILKNLQVKSPKTN